MSLMVRSSHRDRRGARHTVGYVERAWLSTAERPARGKFFALNSRFRCSAEHTAFRWRASGSSVAPSAFAQCSSHRDLLSSVGDAIKRLFPADLLPLSEPWRTVFGNWAAFRWINPPGSAFPDKIIAVDQVIRSPSIWKIDAGVLLRHRAGHQRPTAWNNDFFRYYGFRGCSSLYCQVSAEVLR